MKRPDTFVFVFDISAALCKLRMDYVPAPGEVVVVSELVDNFVKHTIACFQVVSVLGYRVDYTRAHQISWFQSQIEAAQELWRSVRLPPELAGEEVIVHRVDDKVWIVVPNR